MYVLINDFYLYNYTYISLLRRDVSIAIKQKTCICCEVRAFTTSCATLASCLTLECLGPQNTRMRAKIYNKQKVLALKLLLYRLLTHIIQIRESFALVTNALNICCPIPIIIGPTFQSILLTCLLFNSL